MRLTSLEIKGFKSFADKTVINFNDNITGIVGPNGCGKSNVVDAIRWVLGEQKPSSLRSEKMENVIFNGSKKRRASGLAEVSLTFQNTKNILPTEYSEVTISRMYYRNGDSEYRLNNVPCRLKDIMSLFMDTGVSSDSYAIIELGMIDEILNDKENSRRKLFEQAAGIEKYKIRKKETLSKLNSTESDLNRVDDLLFEIENNLKTLESQARRAKRYYKLKDEYKELSVQLAIMLLSDQKTAYKQINRQLEDEQDKKLKIEASIKQLEAQQEKTKAENLEREKKLSELQKKLNQKVTELQQKENEKNLLEEKLRNAEERIRNMAAQMETAEGKTTDYQESIQNISWKISEEEEQLKQEEEKVQQLKQELEEIRKKHAAQKQLVEEKQKNFRDLEQQIYGLEKQMAVHKVQVDNLHNEIEQINLQSKSRFEQMEILKRESEELAKQKELKEKELQELIRKEESLQEEIRSNDKLIDQIKQELVAENRILDSKQNEYQLLKNLIENLEGYPESIKFLRKEVKYTKNAPLLSDIIACRDEYRGAIENYLEPYLNYYVLNTLEEAVESIHMLSNSSKGRANFFILEEFNDYKANTSIRSDNAIAALEILDIDPKYRQLATYLLDKVYIIDDPKEDHSAIQAKEKDAVLLTKNGKFIRSPYSLSGGAVGLFEGKKIGRIKNLEKLKKDIKKLEDKTAQITIKLNELIRKQEERKSNNYKKQIEQAREQLNNLSQNSVSVNTRLENQESISGTASDKLKGIQQKLEQIADADDNIREQLEKLTAERGSKSEGIQQEQEQLTRVADELSKLSERFNQQNIHFHQQQNKLNSFRQELNFKQKQLAEAEHTIQFNKNEISRIEEQAGEQHKSLKHLEEELLQSYDLKEQLEKDVSAAEEIYYKGRGELNELDTKMRELNKQREQSDILLQNIREKLNDLKLNLAGMRERLQVEFKVDINELINQEPTTEYQLDDLQERVEKVKNRLDTYGEINPMAVEAFDEMKQRYDFIIEQKNDLVEAKNNLLQTIFEIDQTAKAQFMDAFTKVRDYFQKVFRTLFTEDDQCDLKLSDPDNPLESKIEILAQPKGKRPLTINQLSGGEKTLTATALLFSLYLIKPAPFCVFDEVDAPLDDANIGKFTNIIKEFSKDSQFIIVTHNKQTMTTVDIIYGVTMMEEGISRVVPVDFGGLN